MIRSLMVSLIRFYRKGISPLTPPSCRFTPTCSSYAEEAIELHGPLRGGWLATRRLLRCRPFGGWGYDPVPGSASGLMSARGSARPNASHPADTTVLQGDARET